MIRLEEFEVRYGTTPAVRVGCFEARSGEVIALVGPNGSGKSSLLKGIAGLVRTTGTREIDGTVAFMPQDNGVGASLMAVEAVLLGRLGSLGLTVPPVEVEMAVATLASLGIEGLADRALGDLSGGQRQLVYLAQALAREPKILLLDEPTSALDVRHTLELLERLQVEAGRGTCILVAIHDLAAALRFFERTVVLDRGAIVADDESSKALTGTVIESIYGVAATILRDVEGRPAVVFDRVRDGKAGSAVATANSSPFPDRLRA